MASRFRDVPPAQLGRDLQQLGHGRLAPHHVDGRHGEGALEVLRRRRPSLEGEHGPDLQAAIELSDEVVLVHGGAPCGEGAGNHLLAVCVPATAALLVARSHAAGLGFQPGPLPFGGRDASRQAASIVSMREIKVLGKEPRSDGGILTDLFGRRSGTLRVSVTDRCNFRCSYCMPAEDMTWFPREGILSFEEIERAVRLVAPLGVGRIRLTGGEPTLRRDLPLLARRLRDVPGVTSLALTTNGVALPRLAPALVAAGVGSVTVSLDSLRRDRFERLCRRDALHAVLDGLDAARSAGFPGGVKVNCVTLRGVNDDEAVDFATFARERDVVVRFIEFMPLDGGAGWEPARVVPGAEVKAAIETVFPLVAADDRPESPARTFSFADGAPGGVGFINPVTQPFCGHCDRLRLTADGKLKNCLFDRGEVDVRSVLRSGADDDAVLEAFVASVRAKGPGGLLELQDPAAYLGLRNMSQVGG